MFSAKKTKNELKTKETSFFRGTTKKNWNYHKFINDAIVFYAHIFAIFFCIKKTTKKNIRNSDSMPGCRKLNSVVI